IDDDGDLFCDGLAESYDNLDCDDNNDLRYPLSPEWCGDNLDNDCDALALVDEADPNGVPVPWYVDVDGDGYGDSAFSVTTCVQPPVFLANADDCDDRSPYADQIYPDAPELCDLLDNDCDLQVDAADPDLTGFCEPASMRFDDFTCSDESAIGADSSLTGWEAISSDLWASDLNDGVGPTVDVVTGTQGSPIDGAENFLVTGHPTWSDIAIQAVVHVANPATGAIGIIGRYASEDSYYQCVLTNDVTPGCSASVGGSRVALIRVDGACVSDDDYTVAESAYAYPQDTDLLIELQIIGGDVRCTVDADLDGVLGSGGDIVLHYVDAAPLPEGRAGLSAFGLGSDGRFDDVRISGFDGDQDGDGLSNPAEVVLGLNANDPDEDDDTISDRDEALDLNDPPNTDGDLTPDHSEADSDEDGIADRAEAGDLSLLTPPDDTDCDGLPDYRDTDADGDGVIDSTDNCRTVPNSPQTDGDSDGLGDDCDPTPTNPDIDGDGLLDGIELAGGTDPNNPDTDGDGLTDGEEVNGGTNRLFSDTDLDGLSDFDEVNLHGTNPLSPDSDGDGAKDGEEVDAGTNPNGT
ncbi:MAG: hypothetical protein GWP91_15890, partial [Rhodobacterales bacterium]|nr:hypothetical protein [Rhodobacterales bacterium]